MIRPDNHMAVRERTFLVALGLITLGGLVLRLIGLGSESFTADEMYSLICTRESDSASTLIRDWVARDGHPPLSYLLEFYWQRLFGTGTFVLRLPFALMGAAAVWWIGRTGARWFSTGAGLAAAAGMAFLHLPLMYSQLTRPYACGLFFTALLAWCWTRFLLDEKPRLAWGIGIVLAAAGAAYSHYFSLLMAGLIGVSGLFFVRGRQWPYLVACAGAVLLFLPYLGIFRGQLATGGIGGASGGWLAAPTPDFFGEHVWVLFNRSRGLLWLTLAVVVLSIIGFFRRPQKMHLLAFLWFALPLLIGYGYSVWRNPVLQHSVLVFSMPFGLLLLFSWFPPLHERRIAWGFPGLLVVAFAGYVTLWKPFHLTDHFGRLKEIAEVARDTEKRYGTNQVTCAFNVDFPYYLGYYWEQLGQPSTVLFTHNGGDRELLALRTALANTRGDYFVYGWSTVYSPPEVQDLIRETYPKLIRRERWFNSAVYVFSRAPQATALPSATYYTSTADFVRGGKGWSVAAAQQLATADSTSGRVQVLDSAQVYSVTWRGTVGQLIATPDERIAVGALLCMPDTNTAVTLAVEFKRNGKQLYWQGRSSRTQYLQRSTPEFQWVYFGLYPPGDLRLSDEVVVYAFRESGGRVYVKALEVAADDGHPGVYGVRKAFEQ